MKKTSGAPRFTVAGKKTDLPARQNSRAPRG